MHKSNKLAYANFGLLVLDFIFLVLSYIATYLISSKLKTLHDIMEFIWMPVIYIPFCIAIMLSLGMYNKTTFNYNDRIIRHVLFSSLVSGTFLTWVMFFIKDAIISRTMFVVYITSSIFLVISERLIYVFFVNKFRHKNATNVIFVGVPDRVAEYAYYVKKTNLIQVQKV